MWSHSGRELFYLSAQSEMMSVAVRRAPRFMFDQPRTLFSTAQLLAVTPVPSFDVSPDDKRFVFLRETSPNERNELIVVQNWTQELEGGARK